MNYQLDIGNDSAQAYDIRPIGDGDSVRLFPGNIAVIKYSVRPKYPLYTSFYCQGEPLANKTLVSSIDTVRTDEYGFANLDVLQNDTIYVLNDDGKQSRTMRFSTRGLKPKDGFAYKDELYCLRK